MTRERSDRHRNTAASEDRYLLLVHNIPKDCRWQDLKDIAKIYCGQRVCFADTIAPSHVTGHVLINGQKNALKAYDEFCHHGWHGRPLQVSLRGPIQNGTLVHGDMLESLKEVRPLAAYPCSPPTSRGNPAEAMLPSYQGSTRYGHQASSSRSSQTSNGQRGPSSRPPAARGPTDRHSNIIEGMRRSPGASTGVIPGMRNDQRTASRHDYDQPGSSTSALLRGRANTDRVTGHTIRLSNVPSSVSDQQLCVILNNFGGAPIDRSRGSNIYARFRHASQASAAFSALNGQILGGNRLEVSVVDERSNGSTAAQNISTPDRHTESPVTTQTRGPLVVDGAKTTRPRYGGRHSPAGSDRGEDD